MTALERIAAALERLADAEEQAALAAIPLRDAVHAVFPATYPASPPETAPAERALAPWDNAPMPMAAPYAAVAGSSYQTPTVTNQNTVAAQPYQYQGPPTTAAPFPPFPVWTCPVHHGNKLVPAGVSKRTGAPYEAFLSCTERDCPQKPPR